MLPQSHLSLYIYINQEIPLSNNVNIRTSNDEILTKFDRDYRGAESSLLSTLHLISIINILNCLPIEGLLEGLYAKFL